MTGERRLVICGIDELETVDSRGFCLDPGDRVHTGFVVRTNDSLHAYRNVCPHAGNPLHWKPHGFLTKNRDLIMCSVHGAIFDIASGRCVGGPCPGRALTPLRVSLEAGNVVIYPD
jgi:nitrite reductase/ring-hydroxylating ferredoxin subunit